MKAKEWKEMVRRWIGDGTFDSRLPEVAALRGVPQPEDYHAEGDAFTHTMLAVEAVDDDSDQRVFWGTLLHDVGKAEKTFFENGRWRSAGHAEAGADMVPAVMDRLGLSDLAHDVAWLVRHHMFHFSWRLGNDPRLTRNQRRFLENPLFTLLLEVCLADAEASHGLSDKGSKIRLIAELYEEECGRGRG